LVPVSEQLHIFTERSGSAQVPINETAAVSEIQHLYPDILLCVLGLAVELRLTAETHQKTAKSYGVFTSWRILATTVLV